MRACKYIIICTYVIRQKTATYAFSENCRILFKIIMRHDQSYFYTLATLPNLKCSRLIPRRPAMVIIIILSNRAIYRGHG